LIVETVYMNRIESSPDPENVISVSQLTSTVKTLLESSPGLTDIWVRGEISNFTHHSSGHMYFSLKDSDAQVRAVMFRRYSQALKALPEEGMEVVAYGSVGIYEKRGEYQLYVRYMQPAGVGALFLQFEKLKKKLMEEGLFEEDLKKPIPFFPSRIAVVTSPTGAAVRDVINVISRRCPAVEVTVVPATVQGMEAPASIRKALGRAAGLPGVDTILLVRGGGSIEDLWGFNDEALARDISKCPMPVVSGVGHETDFTIADFVADLRAPTPSAAAEIAVPDLFELKGKISDAGIRIRRHASDLVRYHRSTLETAGASLSIPRLLEQIDRRRQHIDDIQQATLSQLRYRISSLKDRLEHSEQNLRALDPRNVMERGFAICASPRTGKVIKSVKSVSHGMLLEVTLKDGAFPARADLKTNRDQISLEFD